VHGKVACLGGDHCICVHLGQLLAFLPPTLHQVAKLPTVACSELPAIPPTTTPWHTPHHTTPHHTTPHHTNAMSPRCSLLTDAAIPLEMIKKAYYGQPDYLQWEIWGQEVSSLGHCAKMFWFCNFGFQKREEGRKFWYQQNGVVRKSKTGCKKVGNEGFCRAPCRNPLPWPDPSTWLLPLWCCRHPDRHQLLSSRLLPWSGPSCWPGLRHHLLARCWA